LLPIPAGSELKHIKQQGVPAAELLRASALNDSMIDIRSALRLSHIQGNWRDYTPVLALGKREFGQAKMPKVTDALPG
jgi:hypothetical protein